jgi:hypothetical protein
MRYEDVLSLLRSGYPVFLEVTPVVGYSWRSDGYGSGPHPDRLCSEYDAPIKCLAKVDAVCSSSLHPSSLFL